MVVVDASPLIVLSKIDRLALLKAVYREAWITPRVRQEVVERGLPVDPVGSRRVAEAITAGWIHEAELSAAEKRQARALVAESRLGGGETETLALARSRNATVIVDDKAARMVAERLDPRYLGTLGFLLESSARGHLAADGLEEAIRDLTQVLWLSPAVVAEVLTKARETR